MANPNFGFSTTAEEVTSAYGDQIEGKTILVTGVSPGGLGIETAKALAVHSPALLILAARSQSTLEQAVAAIKEVAPNTPTKTLQLDLSSIKPVRAAAKELNSWDDVSKIDILINNAAVMGCPFALNEDGIETQFATNHIGTWLFTNLIAEKIIKAKGRIVILSSAAHKWAGVRFNDYNFKDGEEYDANLAYAQSKTANILAAISFAEKLGRKGVTAFSVHPGIIKTNLGRHVPREELVKIGLMKEDGEWDENGPYKFKSLSQGSATTLVAALDPKIAERSGEYLVDCKIDHNDAEAHATDRGNAEKLWALSEKIVGQNFEY